MFLESSPKALFDFEVIKLFILEKKYERCKNKTEFMYTLHLNSPIVKILYIHVLRWLFSLSPKNNKFSYITIITFKKQ